MSGCADGADGGVSVTSTIKPFSSDTAVLERRLACDNLVLTGSSADRGLAMGEPNGEAEVMVDVFVSQGYCQMMPGRS